VSGAGAGGPGWTPVIGIAGGVGSGKSTVARMFGDLGCVVLDSDVAAKATLDRPEVVATIRGWWGDGVVTADGGADRKRIADIVFADVAQRARLEGLIHPLLKRDRGEAIRAARARGAAGVVVDAPLLFEAGVDAECDEVVFVECPDEVRLARVAASRGWTREELTRREAAQWPLTRKRAACRFSVENAGDDEASRARLRARVAEVLAAIRAGTKRT
jgi:dephospho-CoA kinase